MIWVEKCWGQSEYTSLKKCEKIVNFQKIEIFYVSFIIFDDIWCMRIKKI